MKCASSVKTSKDSVTQTKEGGKGPSARVARHRDEEEKKLDTRHSRESENDEYRAIV